MQKKEQINQVETGKGENVVIYTCLRKGTNERRRRLGITRTSAHTFSIKKPNIMLVQSERFKIIVAHQTFIE